MKQIIIPYEEYLKLQECYDIVHNKYFSIAYDYDEEEHREIMYRYDTNLLELLNDKVDEIVIKRGS